MTEMKKVVFMSKFKNLNIFLDKGGLVVTPVPGGSVSRMQAARMIKFRNFGYGSANAKEIEEIRQYLLEHPEDGIHEVVPVTAEEILVKKEAKLAAMVAEVAKAREVVGAVPKETPEPVELPEEKKVYAEKCPDCDWVAESFVSEAQMKNKLRGHRAGKHRK